MHESPRWCSQAAQNTQINSQTVDFSHISIVTMKGKEYDIESSNLGLISKKADGRLYQSYHLYSEGLRRPFLRGRLHLFCAAVLLPLGMWHLYGEANGNTWGRLAAVVYVGTNIFCYGVSGIYHLVNWSPRNEILLQKWDHVGIAMLSCGTRFPPTCLLCFHPLDSLRRGPL